MVVIFQLNQINVLERSRTNLYILSLEACVHIISDEFVKSLANVVATLVCYHVIPWHI